jgi:hypothetical protein
VFGVASQFLLPSTSNAAASAAFASIKVDTFGLLATLTPKALEQLILIRINFQIISNFLNYTKLSI